jgi:hypothetical protein
VIQGPRPGGLYALKPSLSNGALLGRQTVTSMQKGASSVATVAGVNGDLFNFADGHPSGLLLRDGVLDNGPAAGRSAVGIDGAGGLHVDRVTLSGTWKGTGQRRVVTLNDTPAESRVTLYTRAWGPRTPNEADAVEATIAPLPPTRPNTELLGPVVQLVQGGNQPIPADGAVLVARRNQAGFLAAEAPVGTTISVRLTLTPTWSDVVDGVGGGPAIVRDGRAIFRANEVFTADQLVPRHPRTAVGQLRDGSIVLVAADGRQPGYSVGMTNFELAVAMTQLGAVTASALDAGGSTTIAFDGKLLNRPSDGRERPVAEALNLLYYGVYAAPPTAPVLSPNGDGVGDTQQLQLKVVRPSQVTAQLAGPNGITIPLDSSSRAPGRYTFSWDAKLADGSAAPEGNWRFAVEADDDLGRHSSADRAFSLNNTLGFVQAPRTLVVSRLGGRLAGGFALARPARVVVTVETPGGVIFRTITLGSLPQGRHTFAWNGRDGKRRPIPSGTYVVRIAASNAVGRAEVSAPLSVRRG